MLTTWIDPHTLDSFRSGRPYSMEFFVTANQRSDGRSVTFGFPDEASALYHATLDDRFLQKFAVASVSFGFHVTFYVISRDAEMTAKFNEVSGAEEFIAMADENPDLAVIEYNFVSSV